MSSLTPEFAAEVRDLLLRPPPDNPYNELKEQLTKRTALSEQRKLQQLFTGEELGDHKPTQLLRRMQQLLGDRPGLDTSFVRELFLQQLPSNVRIILASTPDHTPLDKLAELADKVMEVAAPTVASLTTPPASSTDSPSPLAAEVESLRAEVSRLERLVQQLPRSPRPYSRTGRRSPHRSLTRSPTPSSLPTTQDALCWFHRTFGDQARNCRSPCASNQAGH